MAAGPRLVSGALETEDIRVVLHPSSDVPRLLDEGRITHALVVAGLFWYLQSETGARDG